MELLHIGTTNLAGLGCAIPPQDHVWSTLASLSSWGITNSLSTRCLAGLVLSLLFSLLARAVRGVSASGAAAGGVICFVLFVACGTPALLALLALFILTWASTRAGQSRKQRSGIAETTDGRDASQVFANLGVAAACALLYATRSSSAVLLLASAALAEAAADTVSSEIGKAMSQQARLITTGQKVPAGTDGGITVVGTLSGVLAAVVVSVVFLYPAGLPAQWIGISTGAAVVGTVADSCLGATLERKKLLNNNGVNFISTALAALAAFLLHW